MSDSSPVEIAARAGARWTAVMTKPRCEKTVARYCAAHTIQCYLPLRRRAERYQRRTVVTWLPMFPGYLFVQLDAARQTVLLESRKAVKVVGADKVDEATLVGELCALQVMERMGQTAELDVRPEIVPGEAVRITGGPMHGVTGIVTQRLGTVRVTVNIELLGQSVAVELDVGDMAVDRA